jgi:ribonuclease H / adenosylcobalamin/alpha-ribazole phosphatase
MRHGEVEAPHVGAFIGRTDVDLSPTGRHQSHAIAAYLEPARVDAIVTSPAKRAKETAKPLARSLGMHLDERAGFWEMNFGAWEGLRWDAIASRDPEFAERWQSDPAEHACPGGETTREFAHRVEAALQGVLAEFKGRTVALVSHAGVNRAILGTVTGLPYMETFAFAQDYGAINAAAWGEHGGQIALVNLVPGPRSSNNGDGGRRVAEV